MDINESTPRKDMTIAGKTLPVPQPYAEGHQLSAVEASALNGLLAENLRNNFAARLNKLKEDLEDKDTTPERRAEITAELTDERIAAAFNEYAASYEFGVRKTGGGGRVILDPVMREAMNIARQIVRDALKAQGWQLKDVAAEEIERLAKGLVEANPKIKETAERRVADAKALGGLALGDLPPPPPAGTEASTTEATTDETAAEEVLAAE